MTRGISPGRRVLAIDPAAKGFGFAVMEPGTGLVAWGTRDARDDKYGMSLRRAAELLDTYQPTVVVLEDCRTDGSRRRPHVRRLLRSIERLAARRGVKVWLVPPSTRLAAFAEVGASTKCQIATALAERFPVLRRALPPVRKPWMTEDHRMGIFDAVALAVAFFHAEEGDAIAA